MGGGARRRDLRDRLTLRAFDRGDQAAVRDLLLEGLRERWGDAFDVSMNPDLYDIGASYAAAHLGLGRMRHSGAARARRWAPDAAPGRPSPLVGELGLLGDVRKEAAVVTDALRHAPVAGVDGREQGSVGVHQVAGGGEGAGGVAVPGTGEGRG